MFHKFFNTNVKLVRNAHILFTFFHISVDTGLDTTTFKGYNGKSPMT